MLVVADTKSDQRLALLICHVELAHDTALDAPELVHRLPIGLGRHVHGLGRLRVGRFSPQLVP